jgi:hypothetical protein
MSQRTDVADSVHPMFFDGVRKIASSTARTLTAAADGNARSPNPAAAE